MAEVGVAIGTMYNKIRMANPDAAEQFKNAIMLAMMPFSPVWEPEGLPLRAVRGGAAWVRLFRWI